MTQAPGATPRARSGAYGLTVGAVLALVDVLGGLAAGVYRPEYAVLHLLLVGTLATCALVLAAAILGRRATPDTPTLAAGAALGLAAAQAPWTVAGIGAWGPYALAGAASAVAAGLAAVVLALPALHAHRALVAASRPGAVRRTRTEAGGAPRRRRPAASSSGPAAPPAGAPQGPPAGLIPEGWYPDPLGDGWRWWNGVDWTAHRSEAGA